MTLIARPISDISNSGWTPSSNYYAEVDDSPVNDATKVSSSDDPSSDIFEVKLASLSPSAGGFRSFTVRMRKTDSGQFGAEVSLVHNSTIIATRSISTLTTSFKDYTFELTNLEVAAIPDYSDLRVRVSTTASGAPTDYYIHLLLDETGGEPYVDEMGNVNFQNMHDPNPPTSVAGQIGTALSCDYSSDTCGIQSISTVLTPSNSWTVLLWIKVSNSAAMGSSLPTSGTTDFSLLCVVDGAAEQHTITGTSLAIGYTEDVFELLAFGFDNSSGKSRLSLNGSAWIEETDSMGGATAGLRIANGAVVDTDVVIDDVKVFLRALSNAEIAAIYAAEN